MKTVAFAGTRLFMKFKGMEYFHSRAKEEGLKTLEARADDDAEFVRQVKDAHAIAIIDRTITADMIKSLDQCELIQTLSVGYDCVDVGAATAAGIVVCNTPSYCTDDVASHAMTLLLSVARKIHIILPTTRSGVWDYNFTKPIHNFRDRVLGIIGLGRVGRSVVPKAKGFGIRVSAYDPYLDDDIFEMLGVTRCYELNDLLSQSDYVTMHAPLTAETREMIGKAELESMKPSAFIINTARGGLWNEEAVHEALVNGTIAGAATDVLSSEPADPNHAFLSLDNMLVTPHVAWYSEESFQKEMSDSVDEIVRVLKGYRPRAIVNPEVLVGR